MPDGFVQLLYSILLVAVFFLLTWLITRFHKPEKLEAKLAVPWKEAVLSIGYVVAAFLALALVFFFWSRSMGRPIGTSEQYDFPRVLSEWGIYAIISFVPVLFILRIRRQSFESVGVTRKNLKVSFGVGIVLSVFWLGVNTTPERFLSRVFTFNTLFGFFYFLAVGLGEELLFRGFLQLRCGAWLTEIKGLVVASVIMAFAHLPQRIFAVGMNPVEALVSATFLLPISLLFGFLMLRTQNLLGPTILHTILNLTNIL